MPTVVGAGLENLFGRSQGGSGVADQAAGALRALAEHGVRLFHVYSEGVESLGYLSVILGDNVRKWYESAFSTRGVIVGANHTFPLPWSQDHLLQMAQQWAQKNLTTDWV